MTHTDQENLKICNGCGEIFDANILAESLHHATLVHPPLLPTRRQPPAFRALVVAHAA